MHLKLDQGGGVDSSFTKHWSTIFKHFWTVILILFNVNFLILSISILWCILYIQYL